MTTVYVCCGAFGDVPLTITWGLGIATPMQSAASAGTRRIEVCMTRLIQLAYVELLSVPLCLTKLPNDSPGG